MEFASCGGAAMHPTVSRFMSLAGVTIYEGYGMTEGSPMITGNTAKAAKIGTVGKPVFGIEVRIDAKTIQNVDQKAEGEILFRGDNVMLGYFEDREATEKVKTEDGWLRTGDLGYFDEDGYLTITGRMNEIFKLENGKWFEPTRIENRLAMSSYIQAAMILGESQGTLAIISVNLDEVMSFAINHEIPFSDVFQPTNAEIDSMLNNKCVHDLFKKTIAEQTITCREYERPRKFILTSDEWNPKNGLTTQTYKIKRRAIADKYSSQIEDLLSQDNMITSSMQKVS